MNQNRLWIRELVLMALIVAPALTGCGPTQSSTTPASGGCTPTVAVGCGGPGGCSSGSGGGCSGGTPTVDGTFKVGSSTSTTAPTVAAPTTTTDAPAQAPAVSTAGSLGAK